MLPLITSRSEFFHDTLSLVVGQAGSIAECLVTTFYIYVMALGVGGTQRLVHPVGVIAFLDEAQAFR